MSKRVITRVIASPQEMLIFPIPQSLLLGGWSFYGRFREKQKQTL